MNLYKSLFLLVFTSTMCLGQVKYIDKGTAAPYSGYLFTVDAELENRQKLIDYSINKQQLELYRQNEEILTKQVELWRGQSRDLSLELVKKERMSFWQNTLYFALGAVVTTGLAFGVSRAIR